MAAEAAVQAAGCRGGPANLGLTLRVNPANLRVNPANLGLTLRVNPENLGSTLTLFSWRLHRANPSPANGLTQAYPPL